MGGIEISEGIVKVDQVDVMLDRADVRVWYITLSSKYAVLVSYTDDGLILLGADERTLNTNATTELTSIKIPHLDDGLTLIADCSRYTCRVIAYRLP